MKIVHIAILVLAAWTTCGAQAQPSSVDLGIQAAQRGDYAAARGIWLPLAERGNADAQNNLGVMYERGWGIERNLPMAVEYYQKAANQGNASAQNNLGVAYDRGLGVTKDTTRAAQWYARAAAGGDLNAQNNLGVLTERGDGVVQDLAVAPALVHDGR